MKRFFSFIVLIILVSLIGAPTVSASPPDRQRYEFDVYATSACGSYHLTGDAMVIQGESNYVVHYNMLAVDIYSGESKRSVGHVLVIEGENRILFRDSFLGGTVLAMEIHTPGGIDHFRITHSVNCN